MAVPYFLCTLEGFEVFTIYVRSVSCSFSNLNQNGCEIVRATVTLTHYGPDYDRQGP